MQDLCRALAGALAAHQGKEAVDVMRLSLGHGSSTEAALQLQELLNSAAMGLESAMKEQGEQSPAYGPMASLRTRLMELEPSVFDNLCTSKGMGPSIAQTRRVVILASNELCVRANLWSLLMYRCCHLL